MGSERGQAAVEWVGLALLVALGFGALLAASPRIDGRSFGGFLAHRLACAARGGCDGGERALAGAYGRRDAALVREHAPSLVFEPGERQLPVDPRRCRSRRCADAPDDRELDVHRSHTGERATAFTRVLRRGGRLYIGYWLYFPDSNTTWAGSDRIWELAWLLPRLRGLVSRTPPYPGFHRDDWEALQLRIDPDGRTWARASSHGGYQGCKQSLCRDRWVAATGWTRVSRGSHAGHIPLDVLDRPGPRHRVLRPRYPGLDMRERTTTGEGLRLIPLERMDRTAYRPADPDVKPPWRKRAYGDPESDES